MGKPYICSSNNFLMITMVMDVLKHEYKSNTHQKFYQVYSFKVYHNNDQVDETNGTNKLLSKLRSAQYTNA